MNINEDYQKLLINLGIQIKKLRNEKNLTQEQLEHKCKLTRYDVTIFENGKRNITIKTLFKLAIGLEVSLKELFDFEY